MPAAALGSGSGSGSGSSLGSSSGSVLGSDAAAARFLVGGAGSSRFPLSRRPCRPAALGVRRPRPGILAIAAAAAAALSDGTPERNNNVANCGWWAGGWGWWAGAVGGIESCCMYVAYVPYRSISLTSPAPPAPDLSASCCQLLHASCCQLPARSFTVHVLFIHTRIALDQMQMSVLFPF